MAYANSTPPPFRAVGATHRPGPCKPCGAASLWTRACGHVFGNERVKSSPEGALSLLFASLESKKRVTCSMEWSVVRSLCGSAESYWFGWFVVGGGGEIGCKKFCGVECA